MVLEKLGSSLYDALRKVIRAPVVDRELVKELIRDFQRALLQTTKGQLEVVTGENSRLKTDLATAQADVIALDKKIDDYKASISLLGSQISTLNAKISCLQTEIAKPDAEENPGGC